MIFNPIPFLQNRTGLIVTAEAQDAGIDLSPAVQQFLALNGIEAVVDLEEAATDRPTMVSDRAVQ
jgi:hypothetical protein